MQTIQAAQAQRLIESDRYAEGYATTFSRYKLIDDDKGGIYEQFMPGCFDNCDMSDVIMQRDHTGQVYARISNKTLKLITDEKGLKIGADLSKTEAARGLFEDINTGMITKMSFSFVPDKYKFDRSTRTIIHYAVKKIYDVSAVSLPANDGTEIYTRSFCDGEIKKAMQELYEREKLKLKIKLEGF